MKDGIRLVVFDLGRVLVRICDSWDHACEVAGLDVRLPERVPAVRAALHEAVVEMETGRIDTPEFCRRSASALGIRPEHIRSILDIYLLGLYDGVGDLLDELDSAGKTIACLSNTQTEHWNQMLDPSHRAGLPIHQLRHRFASHLLGLRKPEDAIYAHVEQVTGFPGARIAFFDDLPENIEAAAKRGWHARVVARDSDPVTQIRSHLSELGVLPRASG